MQTNHRLNRLMDQQQGALHIVGIFIVLLLLGGLYILSSWSHELSSLRYEVQDLAHKIEVLEGKVQNLEGRTVP